MRCSFLSYSGKRIFLLLLLALPICLFSQNKETDYIQEATNLLAQNNLQMALLAVNKGLAINPKNTELLNLQGNTYYAEKNFQKAIESYNASLQINPQFKYALANRGLCYQALNMSDKALADYNACIAIDPDYSNVYNNIGELYFEKGSSFYGKATEYFTLAIQKDSKSKYPYFNMCRINYLNELYDESARYCGKAIDIDSNYAEAHYYKGLNLSKQNELQLAINEYTKAIQCNPDYSSAYSQRGYVNWLLDRFDSALYDLTMVIKTDSANAEAYFIRGKLYLSYNSRNVKYNGFAESDFRKALEIQPRYPLVYFNLGSLAYSKKQYDTAAFFYSQCIRYDSSNADAFYYRGLSYFLSGYYSKAVQDLQSHIALNPRDEWGYYNLAVSYENLGDYDKALESFLKCLRVNPKNYSALTEAGNCYISVNMPEKALDLFNQAIVTTPGSPDAYNGRGIANHIMGKYAEAVNDFSKATLIDTNYSAAYANLISTLIADNRFEEALAIYNEMKQRNRVDYFSQDEYWQFMRLFRESSLKQIPSQKYDKAILVLTDAAQKAESSALKDRYRGARARAYLANIYAKLGYIAELQDSMKLAQDFYKKATVINSRIPEAKFGYKSVSRVSQKSATASLPQVTSSQQTLQALPLLTDEKSKPQFYALLIAEEIYDGDFYELKNPVNDAFRLRNLLVDQYNFPAINTTIIKNKNRVEILSALDKILKRMTAADNLLIFYAGHGTAKKDASDKIIQGYWVPIGAQKEETYNFISAADIKDELKQSNAQHILVISDACFSGSFTRGGEAIESATKSVQALYSIKSCQMMGSGDLEPVPDKSKFIELLTETLEANKEPFLTASSLFYKFRDELQTRAFCESLFSSTDEKGEFVFIRNNAKPK